MMYYVLVLSILYAGQPEYINVRLPISTEEGCEKYRKDRIEWLARNHVPVHFAYCTEERPA